MFEAHPIAVFLLSLLLLVWLYTAARLVVWGGAKSWFQAVKRWRNGKQTQEGADDE